MSTRRANRRGDWQVPIGLVWAAAIACVAAFIALNVSDWPAGSLVDFWRDHPIIGASLGTILLAASIFLVYKYQDQRRQDGLDQSVAAAARSGVVDYLVDVDVALALLTEDPARLRREWPEWDAPGRPLRWLRTERTQRLGTRNGEPHDADPRAVGPADELGGDTWRVAVVDQAIRRVSAGLREWGPLMSRSRAGQYDLIDFGSIRLELLGVERELIGGSCNGRRVLDIQQRCRELAWRFENEVAGQTLARVELIRPDWRST